ncbi:cytochrome-c peroxidase [Chlorobium ferrooxidans]|uniref:Cytochrome-c peroxidase n=1 Tax=Chlorobium ferrooxidans DSM 13031 TaxID=377431 RepID=Q0YP23_9CHLB|nr:cytochrome-c peroxidase [Chlorobium ferrooxidans]EAT58045.1 Cytochrome-c peroxidase [Chlorobium ferrooxidans DSM 13031]
MKMHILAVTLLAAGVVTSCSKKEEPKPVPAAVQPAAPVLQPRTGEPVTPIAAPKVADPAMVELGKKLFFDPRLSKSGFISCNSCHNLSMGGSDNLKSSVGHKWNQGPINSPTVLNSGMNLAQFWDGRAKDLKEQAGGPIGNPGEMSFTHDLAVSVLQSIPAYVDEFKKVFNADTIDIDKVTTAIAAFEETLVTPNARFDKWLNGDDAAITKEELAGYELFKSSGCTNCHNGPALGGNSFQKMGIVTPFMTKSKVVGRIAVTKDIADRFKFKVPTLRNVELTYPYFHDGSAQTLSKAVEVMGQIQLGKTYTPEENASLVAFLKSLTGDQPKFELPQLPPSSDTTPAPQPFGK